MPGSMKWTTKWLCTTLAAATGGGGCGEIYRPWTGGMYGAKISPKTTWRASGSVSNPQAAIDEDLATVARSGYRYAGAELLIDLQQNCLFDTIVIDHGEEDRDGYARRLEVATSLTGKSFPKRKQHQAAGTRRITHLLLPKPVLARYLRLRVITPGRRAWAVGEVYVY
jgi:hypothetical protein